ncbi:hypothetical protein EBZ39_02890 [bacterium]|nr:hypothetical protein [bacterium]
MKVEVDLPVSGSAPVRLVVEIPGSVLTAGQCAKAFGVPRQQVGDDCLSGRLTATRNKGGWAIPVGAAVRLYLGEVISEAAQVCGEISKSATTRKRK